MNQIKAVIMAPRSRSSLTMNLLFTLGADIEGEKYPHEDKMDADRLAAAKELNPNGYWEIPSIIGNGLSVAGGQRYADKTIKLTMTGASRTLPIVISHAVVCLRHPLEIAVSQANLLTDGQYANHLGEWKYKDLKISPVRYVIEAGKFARMLSELSDDDLAKYVPFDTDLYLTDPEVALQQLAAAMELSPTEEQMQQAIALINPGLNRSTTMSEWDEELQPIGDVADRIYDALIIMDRGKLLASSIEAEEIAKDIELENTRWIDERVWVEVNSSLCRSLDSNKNNVFTELTSSLITKREINLIADVCEYYARDENEQYTIERPSDLGPLTRPKVFCSRDNEHKSLEQCVRCWKRGSVVDGIRRGPQRNGGEEI